MAILHKFMSMDIFERFCCDPCFRITPSWEQNDAKEFFIDETPAIKEAEKFFGEKAKEKLKKYMNIHGIVSLCNDLMSPHMWDEYADKKKGVAISIEVPEKSPFSIFTNSYSPGFSLNFDRGFLHSPVHYTDTPSKDLRKFKTETFLRYHLTKKERETWGIENETRIILPFDFTSKIIASKSGLEKINTLLSKHGLKKLTIEDKGSHYLDIDMEYINHISISSKMEALAEIWGSAENNDILFLSRVNTGTPGRGCGALRRITLGENADKERFFKIIEDSRSCNLGISEKLVPPLTKENNGIYQANIKEDTLEKL